MILSFLIMAVKIFLTMIYLLAIFVGEFDRKKWWCYLVMVLSIIFVWV